MVPLSDADRTPDSGPHHKACTGPAAERAPPLMMRAPFHVCRPVCVCVCVCVSVSVCAHVCVCTAHGWPKGLAGERKRAREGAKEQRREIERVREQERV